MFTSRTENRVSQPYRHGSAVAGLLLISCLTGSMGCSTVSNWFDNRDPYKVLSESEQGDDRVWALRRLQDSEYHGSSEQAQERLIVQLNVAAKAEKTAPARLAAIETMAELRDPRVIPGLEDAYYSADDFGPDTATVIRSQALAALGKVGHPNGLKLLTSVLEAPRIAEEVSEVEKQQNMDERRTAARALQNFKSRESVAALQKVLENEKDLTMRNVTRESLEVVTGKRISPDAPLVDRILDKVQPGETRLVGSDGELKSEVVPAEREVKEPFRP